MRLQNGLLLFAVAALTAWMLFASRSVAQTALPCQTNSCKCEAGAEYQNTGMPPVGFVDVVIPDPEDTNNGCCLMVPCTQQKKCTYNETIEVNFNQDTEWQYIDHHGAKHNPEGSTSFSPNYSADCGDESTEWGLYTQGGGDDWGKIVFSCGECTPE